MRTLVIDTSSPALSVALFDGPELLAADHRHVGRGHAELLLPAIAGLPGGGRADAIRVGCGPGSFTGTRIGIAAARALAFAWGSELAGFTSPALTAAQVRRISGQADVAVACVGGHGEWLIMQPGEAPQSLVPTLAAALVTTQSVGGDCAAQLVALRGFGQAFEADIDAREVGGLSGDDICPVRPQYARPPDAKPQPVAQAVAP